MTLLGWLTVIGFYYNYDMEARLGAPLQADTAQELPINGPPVDCKCHAL